MFAVMTKISKYELRDFEGACYNWSRVKLQFTFLTTINSSTPGHLPHIPAIETESKAIETESKTIETVFLCIALF